MSLPPSEVSPGDTFEISIEVVNEGGSKVTDIFIRLEMPEGFTSTVTGINTRIVGPNSLFLRDGFGQGFTITVSNDLTPGNYTLKITVTADNQSPQILSPSVRVQKTIANPG